MIKNRQEILFLYDVSDANPNGDPLDSNKPRIDEETGINIVTDVRLKRTIRDYLYNFKGYDGTNGKDIFVREEAATGGGLKDGKARAKDFSDNQEEVLNRAIDIRLFGGVIPLKNDSITFTGPVQFNMGRSLNKVNITHIKGTGAFASTEGKENKTFREEYVLPYSFIAFHGLVNENAAKDTKLTDVDIDLLHEATWNGTKNLITRSKMGHMPRCLIRVVYKESENFFIGDLHKKVRIDSEISDEKLRGIDDFQLDITKLVDDIKKHVDKIEKIVLTIDDNLKFKCCNKEVNIKDVFDVKVEEISF